MECLQENSKALLSGTLRLVSHKCENNENTLTHYRFRVCVHVFRCLFETRCSTLSIDIPFCYWAITICAEILSKVQYVIQR